MSIKFCIATCALTLALSVVLNNTAIPIDTQAVTDSKTVQQYEFEKLGYDNALDQLLAEDGFIYGCDYNYCGDNVDFPCSLGTNHILNKPATWNEYIASKDIYNIKALGFNATSYWLLQDGQGIQFDDEGYAIGIDDEFLTNLRQLLDICRNVDIKLVPALSPHGYADNYGDGNGKETPKEILTKYFKYMWNDKAQDAYITNVINPVCEVLAEYQDVVIAVTLLVENATNMVNDVDAGFYQGINGTTWKKWTQFANRLHRASKQYMPDIPTSIEDAGVYRESKGHEKLYRQNDLEVDFISENYYSNSGGIEPHSVGYTTRPGFIGECNGGYVEGGNNDNPAIAEIRHSFHKSAREGGWLGAFFFSFKAGGLAYEMVKGQTTDYESYYSWTIGFRRSITDQINEYKGIEDSLEKATLLANKGGNTVYWIPGLYNAIYTLERSDDGGKTWKTIAENLDAEDMDNSLNNGLYKYTDNTLKEGINYCYRVISYDYDGNSIVGDPNNCEDYFVPYNILNDSGFENGDFSSDGWIKGGNPAGIITDEESYNGDYSFKIDKANGIGGKNYGAITNNVSVDKNTKYTLSFKYKVVSYESSANTKPYIQVLDPDGNSLKAHWFGASTITEENPDGWSSGSLAFTVPACDYVTVRIVNGPDTVTDFKAYFDDIELKELR